MVDAVHAKGSFIFLQLGAGGRGAFPEYMDSKGLPYVSASDIPLTGQTRAPRPLTKSEIGTFVQAHAKAASNAVKAGFDGVEIHNANGYLLDQFIQDVSNKRTDEYGGSVENRSRFTLEVVDAIANAVGDEKLAIRFSPWGKSQGLVC